MTCEKADWLMCIDAAARLKDRYSAARIKLLICRSVMWWFMR